MIADIKKLLASIDKKEFSPVYLIDGEEPYYLDMITKYFEEKILTEAERDFNLLVLYGKEVGKNDVINTCRRLPMFAERQVVVLKDAGQMKDLSDLVGYIENPTPTTILLIENRFKKMDGRSKVVAMAVKHGYYYTSNKLKDEQLPAFVVQYGKEKNMRIDQQEAEIVASYLGSDLQKIANELDKIAYNISPGDSLTAELIQKYIGISKEYNVFKLPEVLLMNNGDALYKMLHYFSANSKSAPMPLVIGTFYSYFINVYIFMSLRGKSSDEVKKAGYFSEQVKRVAGNFHISRIEDSLLIIGEYGAKSVGVESNLSNEELLKEMVGRLELVLHHR